MDEKDIRELLERIKALEKSNADMESKFEYLESQVQTINRFISAITEAQDIEQTMEEIESVTKQLTDCETATFYCYDKGSDKFFSNEDHRSWQDEQAAEEIKTAFESKEILSDKNEAVIPIVSSGGNALGVIVAKKESGFTPEDYENFRQGGQVVNTVELALKKEFEHQGRITDELTRLKNRQGLNEYLENTLCGNLNDGQEIYVLMCDIDRFKNINDTHGHDVGDMILRGVADVLQEATRNGADCAFRMGGEEMLCILNCQSEQALEYAERVRETIENTIYKITGSKEPVDVKVTISMGLHRMAPDTEMTAENARSVFDSELKYADKALYEAKESGRNRIVCTDNNMTMSYLALKAAEMLCGNDRSNVDALKRETVKILTEDRDYDTVIEALQAYSDEYPEFNDKAEILISRIKETAQKIEGAEYIKEDAEMSSYGRNEGTFYNKEVYREIENKEFLNTDAATAFKIAQRAMEANIEFSAKYNGAHSTVTVDGVRDRAFVEAMRAEFNIPARHNEQPAQYYAPQEKKPAYFGHEAAPQEKGNGPTYYNRDGYRDIQNKEYIRTDSKTAYTISKEAQKFGIEHSVKYDGEKSVVTLDGVKNRDFIEAVRKEFNIPESSRPERQTEKPAYFGHRETPQESRTSYPARDNNSQRKEATYYNREGFKDIQNKTYIRTDSRTAYAISKEAQKYGIEHSVKYDGEKSAVTMDGVKDRDFIETVKRMAEWAEKVQVMEAQNKNRSRYNGAR